MKHIRRFATQEEALKAIIDIPALVYVEDIKRFIFLGKPEDIGNDGIEQIKYSNFGKELSISKDGYLICEDFSNDDKLNKDNLIRLNEKGELTIDEALADILGVHYLYLDQL